uniref:Uncharacterized protein n=1 Tax=Ciona savignyi TaxID=51511 RepID=H2YSL7_CIOSA
MVFPPRTAQVGQKAKVFVPDEHNDELDDLLSGSAQPILPSKQHATKEKPTTVNVDMKSNQNHIGSQDAELDLEDWLDSII